MGCRSITFPVHPNTMKCTTDTDRYGVALSTLCGAVVLFWQPGSVTAEPTRTTTVFERSTQTLASSPAIAIDDDVLLPLQFLVDRVGLERKALPGGKVGVCRHDLCVPFPVGDLPHGIRRMGGGEYVPVRYLAKSLRGTSVWRPEADDLLLDLANRPAVADGSFPDIRNLTLPDLDGKPTSLSRFQGRKVLLFAWASW